MAAGLTRAAVAEILDRLERGEAVTANSLRCSRPEEWPALLWVLAAAKALSPSGPESPRRVEGEVSISAPPLSDEALGELRRMLERDSSDPVRTSPIPDPPPIGRTLGDFELIEEAGRGSTGIVYRARQISLGRDVALKVLNPWLARSSCAAERLHQEARAAAKVEHPNIVALHEIGEADGQLFIAMEYIGGPTLHQINAARTERGLLDDSGDSLAEEILRFSELADGLHVAHECGLVHRDVKPANILMAGDGRLKLADFGLARDEARLRSTLTGDALGTPLYMSPEQARGDWRRVDRRSDIYSLAGALYETLTGRPPVDGEGLPEVLRRIPARDPPRPSALGLHCPVGLEEIVFKALRKDPADRYQTAAELAADLRSWAEGRPVRIGRGARGLRRLRGYLRAAYIAALLLGTVLLINPPRPHPIGAEEYLTRAKRHLSEHEWDEAQVASIRAYHHDPIGPAGLEARLLHGEMLYDQGNMAAAAKNADAVHARADAGPLRNRALLLAAEARLGERREGEALGLLPESGVGLGEGERERAARLRAVVRDFLPVQLQKLKRLGRQVVVGRFRHGHHGILVLGAEPRFLCWKNSQLEESTLAGLPDCSGLQSCVAADLDGDDLDELVLATPDTPGDQDSHVKLRVVSFDSGHPVVEHIEDLGPGTARLDVGDVNADGLEDLLVSESWPSHGIRIFANGPDLRFKELPLGKMAEVERAETDALGIAVADLKGDGTREIVVATGPMELNSLLIYRFEDGGFREIWRRKVGFPTCVRPLDANGDGADEVYFATRAEFHTYATSDFPDFLPQGVHVLRRGSEADSYEITPLDAFCRLQRADEDPKNSRPPNFHAEAVWTGKSKRAGPFVLASLRFLRGQEPQQIEGPYQLRVYCLDRKHRDGLVLATLQDAPIAADVGDVAGDSSDEIVVLTRDGIRIYGLPGAVAAATPSLAPLPAVIRKGFPLRLAIARSFEEHGLLPQAVEAFRELWNEAKGSLEGKEAFHGLRSVCHTMRLHDEYGRLPDEYEQAYLGEASLARYFRAQDLLRDWNLGAAAELFSTIRQRQGGIDDECARDARRRADALEPWTKSTSLELAVHADGRLVPREHGAEHPVEWDGGDFQLVFDVCFRLQPAGCAVRIGFLDVAEKKVRGGLYAEVGRTTTFPAQGGIAWDPPGNGYAMKAWQGEIGRSLPLNTPLRFTLTYRKDVAQAGLVVRWSDPKESETPGRIFVVLELSDVLPAAIASPLPLGFWTDVPQPPGHPTFQIQNARISYPDE